MGTAQTPYEILGEEGVRALASAFYDAMDELPQAHTIRQMHTDNLTEIKQKLFEYLSGWFGGPALYSEKYGSPCLTKPHAAYSIGDTERDQWLLCMEAALARINASDELRQMLKDPMFKIADFIKNQD